MSDSYGYQPHEPTTPPPSEQPWGPPPGYQQWGPPSPPPTPKRRRRWPWVIGGAVALVVVIAAVASSGGDDTKKTATPAASLPAGAAPSTSCEDFGTCETATPEASPTENFFGLTPGTVVTLSNDDMDLAVTVNSISPQAPGEYDDPAGPGLRYIAANVTYDCRKGKCSYNPYDWQARQQDGTSTQYEPLLSLNNQLNSGDLAAGNRVRGNVPFKVSATAHGTIVFSTGLGTEQASWRY